MTEMRKVESSNLEAIGYDADLKRLTVTFKNGRTYRYQNVEEAVFKDMLAADSKGRFFGSNIKGQYDFEREE